MDGKAAARKGESEDLTLVKYNLLGDWQIIYKGLSKTGRNP